MHGIQVSCGQQPATRCHPKCTMLYKRQVMYKQKSTLTATTLSTTSPTVDVPRAAYSETASFPKSPPPPKPPLLKLPPRPPLMVAPPGPEPLSLKRRRADGSSSLGATLRKR